MFVKENGIWRLVGNLFVKDDGSWQLSQLSQLTSITENKICSYGGTYEGEFDKLTVMGPSSITGESCQFIALFNMQNITWNSNWSITGGQAYARIVNGTLTILSGASNSEIEITVTYNGLVATKTVIVTYEEGVSSETETNVETLVDESGNTTTTATIIITTTDESGNTTTTENVQETTTNIDGSSSVTESETISNSDGSSTSNSTTQNYDENGDITGSQTSNVVINSDGSGTGNTTNYDADGDPTDATNNFIDNSGNVDTQDIVYDDSGNTRVVSYTIDTSGSEEGEKDITGDGVDTEFIPFDGSNCGFICHIKFRTNMYEQPRPPIVEDTEDTGSNWLYNIMCAKSPFKGSSAWPGFDIRWAIDKKTGTNGNIQFRYSSANASSTTARSLNGKNDDGTEAGDIYDLTITYDPDLILPGATYKFTVTTKNNCISPIRDNVDFVSNNIDFTLGYATNQQNEPYRYSNVSIQEFSLVKLCSSQPLILLPPIISCDGETVRINCDTPTANIYYRINQSGNYTLYSTPITITADTVVQAYSELNAQTSNTVTQTCVYEESLDEPIITCDGEYVSITCDNPDVEILYRLNRTGEYNLYTSPIAITADTVVEAYSQGYGKTSDIVAQNCIYDPTILEPRISCDGQYVTIVSDVSEAIIYYRLNETGEYGTYSLPFAITADTVVQAYAYYSGETSTIVVETCVYDPSHDYSLDYLTFEVLTTGTIAWKSFGSGYARTIQYSVNGGEWSSITASNSSTISVQQGDSVRFKGTNTTYAGSKSNYAGFEGGTATFDICGNIMSLVYGDNFINNTGLTGTYNFCSIFKKSNVISAENLILPATTLTNYCYRAMFSYAQSLVTPPALPATTLAKGCYWYMFEKCPITSAPDLNVATLPQESYGNMFNGCSSLNYIKCLATNISATSALTNWVSGVAATGTFVKDSSMTGWSVGTSGIPNGWVVYNDEILYDPVISCDGENVTITCETSSATIYYKVNQTRSGYIQYTNPIPITADTIIEAYSEFAGQTSRVVTQDCTYVPHLCKFAGLEISPGPLYYGNNGYEIKDSWNYDSYNQYYGKTVGSYYFNFIEMGKLFENSGFTASNGDIENELEPFDDWRIATIDEWTAILGTTRSGSTVNNSQNKHYAMLQLTGVTHAGSTTPTGLLIFPDGETITGVTLANIDNLSINLDITEQQLINYLNQGCVFLPCDGKKIESGWVKNNDGNYLSSIESGNNSSFIAAFDTSAIVTNASTDKTLSYLPVRLVREASYGIETPFVASTKPLNKWTYNNTQITLPYSVNAIDGHSSSYSKGTFDFETTINLYKAQPTYLWFQHADQSADIYVDNVKVTTHWGGYNAFFTDITNHVHEGTNNIKVSLCNTTRNTLAPCDGDFNFNATLGYVKLLTSPVMPTTDYGYDGFHVNSNYDTSNETATVTVTTTIPEGAKVICKIDDDDYHFVDKKDSTGSAITFTATIQEPTLWDGTIDPHLYMITIEIYHNGDLYHKFQRPYGIRYFEYVINRSGIISGETYTGFLLNGHPYYLRGVCMHNDIDQKANALTNTDIANDFNLISELGCNFIRLAHYPHPKEVYDKCDELGIIVQTEVPWVKNAQSGQPTDYYVHLSGQYEDMVRQHYNHPSIIFWGLSNETTTNDKDFAKAKIEQYTSEIKAIDPDRLVGYVVSHSIANPSTYFNNPNVDWFGANIYVGWYIDKGTNDPTSQLNSRINNIIVTKQKPLAFSEYGCGGTQHCHSENPQETTTKGNYERHDIEYQMWLHEGHIAAIRNFPQLLFTSQWQLFDIAVSNRNEGYTVCLDGENTSIDNSLRRLNNKGLVERDHVTKKDTFYIYKAEWSSEIFVHICGKDYTRMTDRVIKCYSNDGTTFKLYCDNVLIDTVYNVTDNIVTFSSHDFQQGNVIRVEGATTSDTFTF